MARVEPIILRNLTIMRLVQYAAESPSFTMVLELRSIFRNILSRNEHALYSYKPFKPSSAASRINFLATFKLRSSISKYTDQKQADAFLNNISHTLEATPCRTAWRPIIWYILTLSSAFKPGENVIDAGRWR